MTLAAAGVSSFHLAFRKSEPTLVGGRGSRPRTAGLEAWRRSVFVIVLAAMASFHAYGQARQAGAHADADQDRVGSASRVRHQSNGRTVVNLTPNEQQLIGLRTVALAAATRQPEVKAYGRVLDPAPLIQLLGEQESARAVLTASRQEFQRQTALFAQGHNTSAKALETATAAMQRDQAALQTIRAQLVSAWGQAVADRSDLAAFVHSLARRETVLARLDLPSGEGLAAMPTGGWLIVPAWQPLPARMLGRAAMTDPAVQGTGFLLLATNRPPALTPGMTLVGFLLLPGKSLSGVIVPEAAVVRSAGRAWVYAQASATAFARREITLVRPVAEGWLITHGLAPGDRVVTTGAQALLSEERKSEIKLED